MHAFFFYLLAFLFILAGILHLARPGIYRKIMPGWVPYAESVILYTGIIEIILGICLLIPLLSSYSAWSMMVFLVLVFPANIVMAIKYYRKKNRFLWIAIARLPMQFLLIYWAWLYT